MTTGPVLNPARDSVTLPEVRCPATRRLLARSGRLAALLVGIVFIWAGFAKVLNPMSVAPALLEAGFARNHIIPLVIGVLFVDMLVGVLLLLAGGRVVWPAVLAGLVLVGYTGFLGYLGSSESSVACGCLGASTETAEPSHGLAMFRNAGLISLCVLAVAGAMRQRQSRDSLAS